MKIDVKIQYKEKIIKMEHKIDDFIVDNSPINIESFLSISLSQVKKEIIEKIFKRYYK